MRPARIFFLFNCQTPEFSKILKLYILPQKKTKSAIELLKKSQKADRMAFFVEIENKNLYNMKSVLISCF